VLERHHEEKMALLKEFVNALKKINPVTVL